MATTAFNGSINVASGVKFLPADTTTVKVVFSSTGVPYFVRSIYVTSTDTVPRVIDLYMSAGGVNYLLGSVSIPAGQGTAGTPSIDLLATGNISNGVGLNIPGNLNLNAGMESTVTTAKEVDVVTLVIE